MRRPWRRRGLASALIGRTLVALRDRGMTAAQLGVDSENPNEALTLYQRHRFEVLRSDDRVAQAAGRVAGRGRTRLDLGVRGGRAASSRLRPSEGQL